MAPLATPVYDAVIFDIGNVFGLYSTSSVSTIPRKIMAGALACPAWYDFECGSITKQACFERLVQDFSFDVAAWTTAIDDMMAASRFNEELVSAVGTIRAMFPSLRVLALTNMPAPFHAELLPVMRGWGIFDEIRASSDLGCRKPDMDAFERFSHASRIDPSACVFVDDTIENVIAAEAFGFRSIHHQDTASTVAALHNMLGDPVKRGQDWMLRNARNMFCETTLGELHKDNYAQLLILQCTGNRDLVVLKKDGPLWNYFIEAPISAGKGYPVDSDTTALAMILHDTPQEDRDFFMDTVMDNLSPDGLPLCWFDPRRPRFCHCIAANVFRFFHLNGRGHELRSSLSLFCRLLQTRAYLRGSRYYQSPDWLLFILGDLCARRPLDDELRELRHLLLAELRSRMGRDADDLLSAALRLVAAQKLGLRNPEDLRTILAAQEVDGGWRNVLLWGYGTTSVKMGSRGVITALAVQGVQLARRLEERDRYDGN